MFITLDRKMFYKKLKQDKTFKKNLENIYGNIIFDNYFMKKGSIFIYYEKDNILVASLRINKKKDLPKYGKFFQIRNVYVNPYFRGQGYCKKIIAFIVEILRKENIAIMLDVLPDNNPAISCYKSNNFVEIGRKEINGIEHVTMIYKK